MFVQLATQVDLFELRTSHQFTSNKSEIFQSHSKTVKIKLWNI